MDAAELDDCVCGMATRHKTTRASDVMVKRQVMVGQDPFALVQKFCNPILSAKIAERFIIVA